MRPFPAQRLGLPVFTGAGSGAERERRRVSGLQRHPGPTPRITRRRTLLGLALLLGASQLPPGTARAAAPDPALSTDWDRFAQRFVKSDGRVIDNANAQISHSESQGAGLLFAQAAGDRTRFDQIWTFTKSKLAVRDDGLFAWKYTGGGDAVPDKNNATDGDLMIAWALLKAGESWRNPDYADAARPILDAVKTKLVREVAGFTLLLPGMDGFEFDDKVITNLSYTLLPACRLFAQTDPSGPWERLIKSHLQLVEQARFGRFELPPDWLEVLKDAPAGAKKLKVAAGGNFRPHFGYDAIRIPLYLAWGKAPAPLSGRFVAFWDYFKSAPFTPQFANLADDSVSTYDLNPGFRAVADLTRWANKGGQGPLPPVAPIVASDDYYSASLVMLTRLAAAEVRAP